MSQSLFNLSFGLKYTFHIIHHSFIRCDGHSAVNQIICVTLPLVLAGKKYGNNFVGSNFINSIELSNIISLADIASQLGSITISIHNMHHGEYDQLVGCKDNSEASEKDIIDDNIIVNNMLIFFIVFIFFLRFIG